MNEEQARVTVAALDLAIRIKLGQFGEIVEQCMVRDKENEDIEAWCLRRDDAEALLLQVRNIIMPELRDMNSLAGSHGVYSGEETERLYNVLLAVRSCMAWHKKPDGGYTVDFRKPMAIHVAEEMPRCEVVTDGTGQTPANSGTD
jgi:hypothetical protein